MAAGRGWKAADMRSIKYNSHPINFSAWAPDMRPPGVQTSGSAAEVQSIMTIYHCHVSGAMIGGPLHSSDTEFKLSIPFNQLTCFNIYDNLSPRQCATARVSKPHIDWMALKHDCSLTCGRLGAPKNDRTPQILDAGNEFCLSESKPGLERKEFNRSAPIWTVDCASSTNH